MDAAEARLRKIAYLHQINETQFLLALQQAYKEKLIERSYNKPNQVLRVEAYRALFSKGGNGKVGLKTGGLGDKNFIEKKLKEWFKSNPEYSMDDVLNATKYYVDKHISEGKVQYLMQADYFIKKDGRSQLSAMIDEYLEQADEIVLTDSHDWTEEIV